MKHPFRAAAVAALAVAFGLLPASTRAEAKPVGWSLTLNLGAVLTQGNTDTLSGAFKTRIERNWLRTVFYVDGSGMRQDAVETTRFATGSPALNGTVCEAGCTLVETSTRSTKAEKYSAVMGFERRITERFYWDGEAAYDRDLFSGVERKEAGRLGVGYIWSSKEGGELKLGIQATYTDQKEKVPNPDTKEHYAGARLVAEYSAKFGMTKQHTFSSKLGADEDLQVTDDFRATWDNALTVNMTQRLSLQVSDKLAFRNLPALQEVALNPAAGGSSSLKVLTPLKKVDNTLQVALVITWSPHAPAASRPTP